MIHGFLNPLQEKCFCSVNISRALKGSDMNIETSHVETFSS